MASYTLYSNNYNYATSDMQIGTRGRPHLNPGPTFNLSHIRTTTRHQNQIQLIALPPRHGNPKVPHLPNYQDTPRHWKSVGKTLFLGFPISSTLRGPGRLPLLIARASLAPIIDSNPREPTLPGGQPGTRRNKQTNNSTSKVKVLTS